MKATILKKDNREITFIQEGSTKNQVFTLAEWVKESYVNLGACELEVKKGEISFVTMIKDIEGMANQEKINPNEKIKSGSEDIVNFNTLMSKAHGLKKDFSIKTEMLVVDLEKKYALFKARVIVDINEDNEIVFEAHGDATKDNVEGNVAKHWIRIAETRSIVRALRWYTNNADKCAEEEK